MHEVVVNPHVHTPYSDGTWYHAQIAQAASEAGIDVVIATDHNVWVDGVEGYYDNVLLLVGEEVHDVKRTPQCNHLLAYGVDEELAPHPGDSQALIHQIGAKGGASFLAHPVERSSRIRPGMDAIPWDDWEIEGYTGIELWNYMSEFKALSRTRLAAIFYAFFPDLGIKGPYPYTVRLWDRLLLEGRRVAIIGGSDAHGRSYSMGPLHRVVFPYAHLFRCVNTHVLLPGALTRDVPVDKAAVNTALRSGHCFVGYDALGSTRGFRFQARSGSHSAIMGDELKREAALIFRVEVPSGGDIRLLCDGKVVARSNGQQLDLTTAVPGVYRVEVCRNYRSRRRAWIFSNPIYVY